MSCYKSSPGGLVDDLPLEVYIKKNLVGNLRQDINARPELVSTRLNLPGPTRPYGNGCRSLHIACYYVRPDIIQLLLEEGADVNATNDEGLTPIWFLLGFGYGKRRLQHCTERWRPSNGKQMIPTAKILPVPENIEITRLEMEKCGVLTNGWISPHKEVIRGLDIMLRFGADVNKMSEISCPPAHLALECIKVHDLGSLNHILQHSAMDLKLTCGSAALTKAFYYLLVKVKAEDNLVNCITAKLLYATRDIPVVKLRNCHGNLFHFFIKGTRERYGKCWPVMSNSAQARMVDVLIENGCRVNHKDEDGNTPLHLAAIDANVTMVRALVNSGADILKTNLADQTPLRCLLDSHLMVHHLQSWTDAETEQATPSGGDSSSIVSTFLDLFNLLRYDCEGDFNAEKHLALSEKGGMPKLLSFLNRLPAAE